MSAAKAAAGDAHVPGRTRQARALVAAEQAGAAAAAASAAAAAASGTIPAHPYMSTSSPVQGGAAGRAREAGEVTRLIADEGSCKTVGPGRGAVARATADATDESVSSSPRRSVLEKIDLFLASPEKGSAVASPGAQKPGAQV